VYILFEIFHKRCSPLRSITLFGGRFRVHSSTSEFYHPSAPPQAVMSSCFSFDVHVFMCTGVHVFMSSCVHVFMCTSVHVYKCSCVHVLRCSCVQMFMCTGVYLDMCSGVPAVGHVDVIMGCPVHRFSARKVSSEPRCLLIGGEWCLLLTLCCLLPPVNLPLCFTCRVVIIKK